MNNSKFKSRKVMRVLVGFLALLTCIVALMLVPIVFDDTAVEEYRSLTESAHSRAASKSKSPYVATQQRIGVNKDIYVEDGNAQRLHIKIVSTGSDLVFNRKTERMEIFERLSEAQLFMQEELFYQTSDGKDVVAVGEGEYRFRNGGSVDPKEERLIPMQLVRHILADEAVYNFHNDTLEALHSVVSRIILPGHELPDVFEEKNLLLQGDAEKVSLSLNGNRVYFKAEQMKAKLFFPEDSL